MRKISISHLENGNFDKYSEMLPNNPTTDCHFISNKNGVELTVFNFGATISALKIPISEREKVDVVLGFENEKKYQESFQLPGAPYFGSVVGRYAGRIRQGHFAIGKNHFTLMKNLGENHLHGGEKGLSKVFWNLKKIATANNPSITLTYHSSSSDDNYPGELEVEVTYTLTENNELIVDFIATSSEDTIVNLTQHSYFNLDGHSGDIHNQKLFVKSTQILETTSDNTPTGKYIELANHEFNFLNPKNCPSIIDDTFVLDQKNDCKASLFSPKNSLKMSVFTTQPAVHIYVGGSCFNQLKGKDNTDYHSRSGICFETQNYPDAPNHTHFPNSILKKDETYKHSTTFKFENLSMKKNLS